MFRNFRRIRKLYERDRVDRQLAFSDDFCSKAGVTRARFRSGT